MNNDEVLRDPLALAMLAAWLGVRVDQLPSQMRAHTCEDTMRRWEAVGKAALAWHRGEMMAAITNAAIHLDIS